MRAFLSFFERDLNSSTAALTTSGFGSSEGTTNEEAEEGTITAAREEVLNVEAIITNARSKNDSFIVVDLGVIIRNTN